MTIYIVEVANNTDHTLHYENESSGHKFDVRTKVQMASDSDAWVPTSKYKADPVPFRSDDKYIKIQLDDGPMIKISDSNWQFSITRPYPYSTDSTEAKYGNLTSGGEYLLRVDQKYDGRTTTCSLSFLVYKPDFTHKLDGSYILLEALQHAIPIIGNAMGGVLGS